MSDVVLQAMGLSKRYGDLLAVRNLSLNVRAGEVFGLLGPNGAGKTTSLNMLCGLLKPDSGQVTIQGKPITDWNANLKAQVGVCPQETVLWKKLTCLEQLQFIGEMYGMKATDAKMRGIKLLEQV